MALRWKARPHRNDSRMVNRPEERLSGSAVGVALGCSVGAVLYSLQAIHQASPKRCPTFGSSVTSLGELVVNIPRRNFEQRPPAFQDAVLINLFCPDCRKDLYLATEVAEYEEDDGVYFEATCYRCGRKCRLALRDIPQSIPANPCDKRSRVLVASRKEDADVRGSNGSAPIA